MTRGLKRSLPKQGPQSPDVARLKSDLGWVLMEQGALVEARAELEQSRAIREAVLGADHPALGSSWSELASLADALGDMDEAVRCMERALAIDVLAKGEDSVGVARKRLGLAVQLTSAGRAAEAVAPLRLAQATIARRPESPPSTRVLATRTAAKIEADLGRPAEAVKLGQEALTTAEAMEVTRIYSVAGLLPSNTGLIATRPFRAPRYREPAMRGMAGSRR